MSNNKTLKENRLLTQKHVKALLEVELGVKSIIVFIILKLISHLGSNFKVQPPENHESH